MELENKDTDGKLSKNFDLKHKVMQQRKGIN